MQIALAMHLENDYYLVVGKLEENEMKLKSTKQEVFTIPWIAEGKQPWPKGYTRIFIPYQNKAKNGDYGQIVIVNMSSLSME